jgi:hypothetical protein
MSFIIFIFTVCVCALLYNDSTPNSVCIFETPAMLLSVYLLLHQKKSGTLLFIIIDVDHFICFSDEVER